LKRRRIATLGPRIPSIDATRVKPERFERPSARKRGYTWDWEKAAHAHKVANPLCRPCLQEGRITPADEVDHIIPHHGDMALFWDRDNWQSICRPCHEAKTAREQTGGRV
jgi:5-methylcytosine-specific restriction protein A